MTASPLLRRYGVRVVSARRSLLEGLRGRDVLLVAAEAGEIIGMAWLITSRALDRSAYLRLLLVAEGRGSRGVGAALLEAGERRARSRRCRHVVLLVTATNRRARAFYTRHGYRRVGVLPDFARRGIAEALYAKALS
jgi:ribosomal protein S18 acetylase RimI-like enzyme